MPYDVEFQKNDSTQWHRHRSYTDYATADKNYEKYKEINPRYGWRIVEHVVNIYAAYTPTRKGERHD